jgi:hypothetical protein
VPVSLLNNGTATLSITSIGFAVGTNFSQTNTCGATLAVNASCTINVKFSPTVAGTLSDTLQVTDNAAGSPHTVGLTGTGITSRVALTGHVLVSGNVLVQ